MRLKHVFMTLGLASVMALGVGVAMARSHKNLVEVKETQASGETFYLAGSRNSWNLENTDVAIVEGAAAQQIEFTEGEQFKFHTGTTGWDDELNTNHIRGTALGYFDKENDGASYGGNIYCKKAGTYNVYIRGTLVYFDVFSVSGNADVYVQIKGWSHTYIYAYDSTTDEGYTWKPLGLYPGTEVTNVTTGINYYSDLGGIGKFTVPYKNISNTKIIISNGGTGSGNQSSAMTLYNGYYYWNTGSVGDNTNGLCAATVFDIAKLVEGATNSSVCNVSKSDANTVLTAHSSFLTHDIVEKSTLYTWANKERTSEKDYTLQEVIAQLQAIADGPGGSNTISGIVNDSNTAMIIAVVSSITVISALGTFFIIRRRKHN